MRKSISGLESKIDDIFTLLNEKKTQKKKAKKKNK